MEIMNYTTEKRKNGKGIKIQFELTEEQIFISKLKKGDKVDFSKDGLKFYEARIWNLFEWRQSNEIRIIVRPLVENWRANCGTYGFTYRDFTRYHGIPNAIICPLHSITRNWRSELKVFDFIDFVIPKYIQELFTSKLERNYCYSGMIIAKTNNYIYVSATIPHLCDLDWENEIYFTPYTSSTNPGIFTIPFTIDSDDIFENETITEMKIKPCCGLDSHNKLQAQHFCLNRKYLDPEFISDFIRIFSYKTLFLDFASKFEDDTTVCPICLEELDLMKLGCGHKCCENCFHTMFMNSQCYMNTKMECPLCRKNVFQYNSTGHHIFRAPIGIDGKYNKKYLNVIFNHCHVRDKNGIKYTVSSRENLSEQIKKDCVFALKKCEVNLSNDNGCIFKKRTEIEIDEDYNVSIIHFRNPKGGAITVDLKKAARYQTHIIKKRIETLSSSVKCRRVDCACENSKITKPYKKCIKSLNGVCHRYKPYWDNFILYLTDRYSLDESKFHMTILTKFLKKYYPHYFISYEGTKCYKNYE